MYISEGIQNQRNTKRLFYPRITLSRSFESQASAGYVGLARVNKKKSNWWRLMSLIVELANTHK